MKSLMMILLSLGIAGCGDRNVENPAAEAPLFFEEEFEAEAKTLLTGSNIYNSSLVFRLDATKNAVDEVDYEVVIIQDPNSPERRERIKKALNAEAERIEEFLNKYNGTFRIRYRDGDLKAMTLRDQTKSKLRNLKKAWLKALKKIETL